MQVDLGRWLSLVTRDSVRSAVARVETVDLTVLSEHRLHADDLLHWSYAVRQGDDDVRRSCDGRELVQPTANGKPVRSQVPTEQIGDDPWYFYSWPGVVDAWFVEMLRPVDLLARIVVSAVAGPDDAGLIRITATPMGNEPSPYNGFAVPDGRSLRLVLDVERGCLLTVTVDRAGGPTLTHRLTEVT
ncbi:hypothetical protein O7602_28505 [Micromonospora sp. WMMD1128]|uniref:hypothetical protein n=1 Tax=Micromonospora sp. WMMD1128 TaxID=3015150 RepID=UPI00248B53EE|nr:hypothetical protein [Micromonospora sp. WMMD1128]WBB73562.1 hypothetical protein O7602_28505 [Micromonospora sp. WMMD1128]